MQYLSYLVGARGFAHYGFDFLSKPALAHLGSLSQPSMAAFPHQFGGCLASNPPKCSLVKTYGRGERI